MMISHCFVCKEKLYNIGTSNFRCYRECTAFMPLGGIWIISVDLDFAQRYYACLSPNGSFYIADGRNLIISESKEFFSLDEFQNFVINSKEQLSFL